MSQLTAMDSPQTEEEESELTYADLYGNIALNNEIIITIPTSEIERTKTGLKNYKARLKAKEEEIGMIGDRSYLEFESKVSEEFPDCSDLRIILKKPSSVRVKKIVVPEQLPE